MCLGTSERQIAVLLVDLGKIGRAAHRGGMKAIGIGTARLLPSAELTIPGFSGVMPDALLAQLL